MTHRSDSTAQREAENLIRAKLAEELKTELQSEVISLEGGARMQVDGVSPDEDCFVEIFARQGALNAGQQHKIKGDALKLITLARSRESPKLILAFGSSEAASYALNKSWLAEALRMWGVEVFVVELEPDIKEGLRATQVRQMMVNPPTQASN